MRHLLRSVLHQRENQIRLVVDIDPQYNPNKDSTPRLNYYVSMKKDSHETCNIKILSCVNRSDKSKTEVFFQSNRKRKVPH